MRSEWAGSWVLVLGASALLGRTSGASPDNRGLSCKLTGAYADAGGQYTLQQTSPTRVHITSDQGAWQPLDASLSGSVLTAKFSNSAAALTGDVSANCASISWSNGVTWKKTVPAPNITSVHLVYMTHLDLGFTDTTRNVCDEYFDSFFPAAFKTAADLRARGGVERFRWTEFPWLIQEYLDGGARCSHTSRTREQVAAMEEAIKQDDVIWLGTAVNFLPEVLDEPMWDYSLRMASRLNTAFNKSWGKVGKHTDTPGMSRSAIPALAKNGVKAYHIGYNAACAKNVALLPAAFRWLHNETQTELLTMVNDNYGSQILIPEKSSSGRDRDSDKPLQGAHLYHPQLTGAEGVALVFQFSPDNTGVPDADGVVKFWTALQARFPHATIHASSLDDFAAELFAKADFASIPVITGELGDSWLYGTLPATGPVKLSLSN